MEWSANSGIDNKDEEIKNADYSTIRFFTVDKRTSATPQDDVSGRWEVSTPNTMADFSTVAYFFARRIQQEMNIPIGLMMLHGELHVQKFGLRNTYLTKMRS